MSRRPPDPESGWQGGPLDDWLTRYDDALLRGESPPEPPGPEAGLAADELERLRSLLERLDDACRPGGGPVPTEAETLDMPAPPTAVAADPPFGGAIGRFRIERELGQGGFGVVFLAHDPEMARRVALKLPKAGALLTADLRRRFLGEARAAARLDHPNLVPVFEAGEAAGVCYIAAAYCEGPTLRRWLDEGNAPTDPRRAARLAMVLARAIEHMHVRGLLHCDLKPSNVLLARPADGDDGGAGGADPVPRVTDFGLARLTEAVAIDSTAMRPWGTPPYMAPEQIRQDRAAIGPATDVYALGAILCELLTGRPPHEGGSVWDLLRAVVVEPPTSPRQVRPAVPRDLDAITLRCLEKRPDRRYRDAAALAADLERFLDRRPTVARPLGPVRRSARWARRHPGIASVTAMGLLLLAVSLVASAVLLRTVRDLDRANLAAASALTSERRHVYDATLALAQQELDRGRAAQAQRLLRELMPGPGQDDLRDFAWHYLWRQSRLDRTVLDALFPGTAARVSAGDGVLLAISEDEAAALWRIERPSPGGAVAIDRVRPRFRPDRPPVLGDAPADAALLPDGRLVVLVHEAGAPGLSAVAVATGRTVATAATPPIHHDGFRASPDGTAIAFGIQHTQSLVRRALPIGDGRALAALGVGDARDLAFTADRRRIAAAAVVGPEWTDCALVLWDVATGVCLVRSAGPIGPAVDASPRPGGPIATATPGGVVQLRDALSGKVTATLPAPELPPGRRSRLVRSLAFSPDGRRLVAAYDRLAILWDVESRRPVATLDDLASWVHCAAFLPGWPGEIALGIYTGEVIVWHTEPVAEAIVPGGHDDEVWGVAYDPGGRTFASIGGDRVVKLWNAATGRERVALPGHREWPSAIAYHPGGRLLATADYGGEVLIWDAEAARLVHRIEAHEHRVRALAFSPDGRLLATGGYDREIRLWLAATGRPMGVLGRHDGEVRGLAFTPDGELLVSAGKDGWVVAWEVDRRRPRHRLEATIDSTCVAVAPDGRTAASGDIRGAVTLWDLERGRRLSSLSALHSEEVSALAFGPDGRGLATAGQDGVVMLVDVATGRRTSR